MKKRRIKLGNKLYKALDLPEEALFALRVTILENESVLIENHNGIFIYDNVCIKIKTERGLLSVLGKKLVIEEISPERMLIIGEISGVEME
ncbi:MAG: YabP/YqfC family sporulation protein [Clostridia bacterium]